MGTRLPAELRERLGHDASLGLLDALDDAQKEWSDRVLNMASDRFECRLAQEAAQLREQLHEGLAGVRQEMGMFRAELLKWSFLFWIGQVAAIAGLLAYMLPRP